MLNLINNLKRKYIKYKMNQMFQECMDNLEKYNENIKNEIEKTCNEQIEFINSTNYETRFNNKDYSDDYLDYLEIKYGNFEIRLNGLRNSSKRWMCNLCELRTTYYEWAKNFENRECGLESYLIIAKSFKTMNKILK